jgi:hypothetical protein
MLIAVLLMTGCPSDPTPEPQTQAPVQPAITSVVSGDGSLRVTWGTVSGAESYEVYYHTSDTTTGVTKFGTEFTDTTTTITGLTNYTLYYVWVKAKNSAGSSDFSQSSSGTPTETPVVLAQPTITSIVPGDGSLTVTWGTVSGAENYEVYSHTSNTSADATKFATEFTTTTATITGLTNGTTYYVWVKAKNSGGESEYSDPLTGVPFDPTLLTALKGTWASSYGEEFIINDTEFFSGWGGTTTYKGSIVNVRSDDDDGYITIRYTENTYSPNVVGNYYVIRWENLAAATVTISGASNDEVGGAGYSSITAAETNYTGDIGTKPFQFGSDCYLIATQGRHSAIEGSWDYGSGASSESYIITDKLVIYALGGYTFFVGEIVNVRNLESDTNYITFRYITNEVDGDLAGKYCALYWTEFTADTSVEIATAYSSSSPGDEGQDTQAAAEAEYTIDNVSDYFSDLYQFAPPSY